VALTRNSAARLSAASTLLSTTRIQWTMGVWEPSDGPVMASAIVRILMDHFERA
jgi:hypothetical protein